MTDSDADRPDDDSGEAGDYVDPVDHGDGNDSVGTDPATDRGDFTSSTEREDLSRPRPNVERPDGEYTASESNPDDAAGEGEYTDRDE